MFDYEDRAMFVAKPANDEELEARSLLEGMATADHRVDAQLAWLGAIGLLGTLVFALFLISRI